MECESCGNKTIHPEDLKEYSDFQNLKKKKFQVKLRYIGNSYAVSIPREIIDFMSEQEKDMNEMVNLCMKDFGRRSEEHTSELQSHSFISYAVFCLKKKKQHTVTNFFI